MRALDALAVVWICLLRSGWQRDIRSIRDVALAIDDDEALERFLARRALEHLPYRRLRRVSEHPWRDYEEGRTATLAEAELQRIGLRPTRHDGTARSEPS